MSKTVKRKITVELPKPRDLSKNRLSVFQRLGTKKLKSLETAVNVGVCNPSESNLIQFFCSSDQHKTKGIKNRLNSNNNHCTRAKTGQC